MPPMVPYNHEPLHVLAASPAIYWPMSLPLYLQYCYISQTETEVTSHLGYN